MLMNNKNNNGTFLNDISKKRLTNLFNESCPYYTSFPTLGLWSDKYTEKSYREDLESTTL